MPEMDIQKRQLRSFGLIVGTGFGVIALWPLVFRGESPRMWALTIALVLPVAALVLPSILKVPYRLWMAVGEKLGWINTRIILSLVYYGLIVPIGTVRRMMGADPLRRHFDPAAETYRILRAKRPASHLRRQY